MNNLFRRLTVPLLLLVLAIVVMDMMGPRTHPQATWSYSYMLQEVRSGNVAAVTITDQSVTGKMKDGRGFQTTIPTNDPSLYPLLDSRGVSVSVNSAAANSPWWAFMIQFLPTLLIIGALFFFMQNAQGGGSRVMQFGKTRARPYTDDRRRVTFEDVAGVEEVKEELQEIVDYLKHPKRYVEVGARIPKGVLLFGEPGTGKTLLARAVAGEAGVPFFPISGSDFVEMFVGVGASRVRDLFEQAKKNSPCIVFIDEIDAVGRMRGAGYGGGHDEREQTLNQLLVEMDGFGVNEGIIVIAATNRPDVLDAALLRPGRFDRQVYILRPDLLGRKEILEVHSRNKPLDKDVELEQIARLTPGFTGADLANLLNEAALLTARRRRKRISMSEVSEAVERVIAGPQRKSRIMNDKERRMVAYHEAGHALVGHFLKHSNPVVKVSIIPRGRALGYTLNSPTEDRFLMSRDEILDDVAMMLGGRTAEELIFGELTSGASDDLERATKLVRKMITEWGMSERLGPMTYGTKQDQVFLGRDLMRERNYSENVAAEIDEEIRTTITECHERARQLLEERMGKLHKLTERLLEKETVEREEFVALVEENEKAS